MADLDALVFDGPGTGGRAGRIFGVAAAEEAQRVAKRGIGDCRRTGGKGAT
jgi:hypothetical protein